MLGSASLPIIIFVQLASIQSAVAQCGSEGGVHQSPCDLPPWPSTWQMNASTIIMPCNYTGYQVPSTVAGWGIVDFDWSNALDDWSAATPMDNDERQLIQVKMIKESSSTAPYTKIWIYRNTVYGYPWFTSVRKILDDPAYEPWFIMFNESVINGSITPTSPMCDANYKPPKCTKYFHTQMDTPLPRPGGYGECHPKDNKTGCDCGTKPCGFYVFNHSSTAIINGQTFRDWFIDTYMYNEVGSSPLVDGFYWDDTWYPGGVGDDPFKNMNYDMGLTTSDLLQLTNSYTKTMAVLRKRTLAKGKFAWQLMGGGLGGWHVNTENPMQCKADLTSYCKPGAAPQVQAMYYRLSMNSFSQDLASFLLIRGEYAWLGHSWQNCNQPPASEGGGYPFPTQLHDDFGTPLGLCAESDPGSGVFVREFSKASIMVDCNTGTPSIMMKKEQEELQV